MMDAMKKIYASSGGVTPFPCVTQGICEFAYRDVAPIGFVYTLPLSDRVAEILHLCVVPEWQRQGVARELILGLQEKYDTLHLEVEGTNKPALRLYESLGFTVQRERQHYYGANRHAHDMSWHAR